MIYKATVLCCLADMATRKAISPVVERSYYFMLAPGDGDPVEVNTLFRARQVFYSEAMHDRIPEISMATMLLEIDYYVDATLVDTTVYRDHEKFFKENPNVALYSYS